MIGPTTPPPRPPARLTPPRTMAATLSSVYGPGTGRPDRRARGEAQPGERGYQAHERVGADPVRPTGTPLRKAASRSLPMAYSDRPSLDRPMRIQTTATMTRRTTAPWGPTHCRATVRSRDSMSHFAASPPGEVRDQKCATGPDERHRQGDHDVRHPGDDDQAAVDGAEGDAEGEHRRGPRRRRTPSIGPS